MNYRSASYNAKGTIDCEIEHSVYGWIPFTADPNDVEQTGKDIHAQALADNNISAYVAPVIAPEILEAQRIASIKAKAGELITEAYPEWMQRNMIAESVMLQRNDPTNARLDELETVWAWVANIRAISNQAEIDGTALDAINWG